MGTRFIFGVNQNTNAIELTGTAPRNAVPAVDTAFGAVTQAVSEPIAAMSIRTFER